MTFTRIFVLLDLIEKFKTSNQGYNFDILIFVGLNSLTELRKKARSQISKSEDGSELFKGGKITLEANKGADYLAIAYLDPRTKKYLYLTEIE